MTEPTTPSDKPAFVQLTLDINTDQGLVSAVLSECVIQSDLTVVQVRDQLNTRGVGTWDINAGAIEDLIHKFKKNTVCRIVIAERKNASFRIKIDESGMSATLYYEPPLGGQALTHAAVIEALEEKKVNSKRIIQAAIDKVITTTTPDIVVVAKGKSPKVGRDSFFSPLIVHPEASIAPVEDENGKVDFLAGKEYLTVTAGTPLLERVPPQPGQMGMDIFGQLIPAESGAEVPFGKDLGGTEFASNDPNLLIAQINGHPVFFADGARVDETLQFKQVDLTTGHITFDGSINVKGDVMPDMKINVTGDIFIKGVVERSQLTAGNDITIGGGILGDTQTTITEDDALPELECIVKAGGIIKARYVNLAHVEAKNKIEIKEYAFNSYLKADNDILLGQDGGKGNLVGGDAIAGHAIVAKALGNKAYNRTKVRIGISNAELQQVQKLKFLRDQRITQARSLRALLENFKAQGEIEKLGNLELNKARKVKETLLKLQADLKTLDDRLRQFDFAHFQEDEPHVSATSQCYPNVKITINGAIFQTTQEQKAITYLKRGRKITVKS